MDQSQREQLERIGERAIKRADLELKARVRQVYAEHSARGVLGSTGTLKAGVRVMGEIGRETLISLKEEVAEVERSEESYNFLAETMKKVLDGFGGQLTDLDRMAARNLRSQSMVSAVLGLYREMRSDLESDLLIERHKFLTSEERPVSKALASPGIAKGVGGKPLAKHWDAMWAEIATKLWDGSLKPESQADIKRAMFDWLSSNEIETGDTAVTERARALWLRMQAED